MKSEWRISKIPIGDGQHLYQVCRLYDVQKTDHSGNREEYMAYQRREEAEYTADRLNREATP